MTATVRPRWREIALPSEHGGWSLTAEPVVLGLLAQWSLGGLALGLAAMVGFVFRTPLKVVLVDRWRGRWFERTSLAARVAVVEGVVLIALAVLAAVASASGWFWIPLAMAGPMIALELWFDMRSRSRRLAPEMAGTIGIGSVAAAIVLVGGGSAGLAAGLWAVVAARAVAAIPLVRVQIDRVHQRSVELWTSDGAQLLAPVIAGLAWLVGWVPFAPTVALAVVGLFGIVSVRRSPRPAVVIGVQQMVIGLAVVLVTAAALA